MISSLLNKVFIGGVKKPMIPIIGSTIGIIIVGLLIGVLDLVIRGFILEYGYNLLVKKIKLDLPKLDLLDCLILIIIAMCIFRN